MAVIQHGLLADRGTGFRNSSLHSDFFLFFKISMLINGYHGGTFNHMYLHTFMYLIHSFLPFLAIPAEWNSLEQETWHGCLQMSLQLDEFRCFPNISAFYFPSGHGEVSIKIYRKPAQSDCQSVAVVSSGRFLKNQPSSCPEQ